MTDGQLTNVVNHLRQALRAETWTDAQLLKRFIADRSDTAFRDLLLRHGPMVFGVCRRWLGHVQDAEDAFQAVFIVLARKAEAIQPPAAVGRWLYGTAVRTARKAKYRRDRLRNREARIAESQKPPNRVLAEPLDWLPMLDEELNRLPEKHRLPIILCDLLGRSRQEAAAEIGIAEGTLSSRLARARNHLRDRLLRRGVLPATVAGVLETPFQVNAEVPISLLEPTIHACCEPAIASISNAATFLAEGVIRSMFICKLQKILAIVLMAAVVGGVGWSFGSQQLADPKPPLSKGAEPNVNEDPNKVPEEKAKPDPKKEDRVTVLRKELRETLKAQVKGLFARIRAGKDPLITILVANKNLMTAELDLCATPKQRMAVYEAALKRFKIIEDLKVEELDMGKSTLHEVAQAKAARLEIEILWEQAKAK